MTQDVLPVSGKLSKVIVIGAGFSGLSAAKLLDETKTVEVTVLEARDRVGGRSLTKRDSKISWVDLGCSYFGPTQNRVIRMGKEYGVKNYMVYDSGITVHFSKGKRMLIPNDATSPATMNPFKKMDMNNLFRTVDALGETIPLDSPWSAPNAYELDRTDAKTFAEKICWTTYTKEFWRLFLNLNFCCEPYELSTLFVCWYVRACGGVSRIMAVTNGGQERKFVGGSMQIPENIARELGDRVKLNNPVVSIEDFEDYVKVKTLSGETYQANHVILAIPPILQMKIHFSPSLPSERNQMIQKIPMGSVIKCMVYYKTAFWREHNLSGTFGVIDSSLEHPFAYTVDDSKPGGSNPCIMGFISSEKATHLCKLSKEERFDLISKSLAKISGLDAFLKPVHYEEMNWLAEQYSGGCYVGHFPPGCLTTYGKILRKPCGKIYFAGTETATHWSGYMEGAIQAGERAAREILCAMGHISDSQIWEPEPPSEEIVARPFEMSFMEKYLPSVTSLVRFVSGSSFIAALAAAAFFYKKHISR